jgi:hypothetical protein
MKAPQIRDRCTCNSAQETDRTAEGTEVGAVLSWLPLKVTEEDSRRNVQFSAESVILPLFQLLLPRASEPSNVSHFWLETVL